MQFSASGKLSLRNRCLLLFCLGLIILGAVCCGAVTAMPYSMTFRQSSGQCQGGVASQGGQELAVVTTSGPNITICILRASDGSLLRNYDLPVYGDLVGSGDGLLYINERGGQQGNSLALCAVQISDGIERWCQTQLVAITTVIVKHGNVYASTSDQTLVASVSERDGRILWRFQGVALTYADTPLIVATSQTVYVSTSEASSANSSTATAQTPNLASADRVVCALRADNGQKRWCVQAGGQSIAGMAVDEQTLYVRTLDTVSLNAFNATNGSLRWTTQMAMTQSTNAKSLPILIAQGMVFANGPAQSVVENYPYSQEQLYALRASDGKQLWHTTYNGQLDSLAATQQLILLITKAGDIYAFNLLNGQSAWFHGNSPEITPQTFSSVTSSIVVAPGVTYMLISSSDYQYTYLHMLALKTSNGAILWNAQACPGVATPITSTPIAPSSTTHCYWESTNRQSIQQKASMMLIDN